MEIKLINNQDQELLLPFSLSWLDVPLNINVPNVRLSKGGSARNGKETLDNRQFSISGTIYNVNKQDTLNKKDEILGFLQYTPIKVFQKKDDNRYINAFVSSINQSYLDDRSELGLSIDMLALDPFFYYKDTEGIDDIYQVGVQYALGTTMTPEARFITPNMPVEEEAYYTVDIWVPQPLNLQLFNSGNREVYPEVEVTGQNFGGNDKTVNIVIENLTNGSKVEYAGTISAGDILEINSKDTEVKLNADNKLNNVNDEFLLYSFLLNPGNNDIKVSWGSDEDASLEIGIKINYRSRWL